MNDKKILRQLSKNDLIEEIFDRDSIIIEHVNRIAELERLIKKYDNPHTPSSQKNRNERTGEDKKVGRKKGKKSNHNGKTREKEEPNTVVEVGADCNPETGNTNIRETGYVKEVQITDVKLIKTVTQYNCKEYYDLDTGKMFIARHPDMPKRGIFGKEVLAIVNYLHFRCRVTFGKIATTFCDVFGISMTTPTAMDICTRVSDQVEPQYEALKVEIREEKAVNADETGAKRNGMPGWLWGFFTKLIALFFFNKKRGGDIIERVLGRRFKGILGCDGWSTYVVFSKKFLIFLQRCWAHPIRELKALCIDRKDKDKDLEGAYHAFCKMFEKLKVAMLIPSVDTRKKEYNNLNLEMIQWIQTFSSYNKLRKMVTKVQNGLQWWFTCVLHPEIDPTNNLAERGLRDWVVIRKIIGCLRSEQGEKTTAIMLSVLTTWKLRGLNPYQQLKALL